jgi:hypothetical protein
MALDTALGTTTNATDLLSSTGKARSMGDIQQVRTEAGKGVLRSMEAEKEAAIKAPEEKARIEGEYAQKEAKAYESADVARKKALEAAPLPEFKPNEDTIVGMASLGSLIALTGQLLGNTGGKQSAIAAIDSMSGMMAGYQQGKKDLFKMQQVEFEKNFQAMKAKQEQIQKEFESAVKKIPYDLAGARQEMAVALAKANSPLLKATYEKQGYMAVMDIIKQSGEDVRHMEKMAQDLKIAQAKVSKVADLPKDKDTNNQYLARKGVINNITDIESLLNNPKYAALIGPETKFTPDLINNLRDKFPELSQKLARIQAIEFEIGGKNLTKNEASILEPIYGWKGLTVPALRERIKGVKEDFQDKNTYLEMRYPGFKTIGEQIDQYYVTKGKAPGSTADIGGEGAKVATKDDIAVTAAKNNISEQEAKDRLRNRGFKIEGED